MTEQDPDGGEGKVQDPTSPSDLERIVDDLEKRVLGHRVDQLRDEDDVPEKSAFEQDLDTEDSESEPDTGPGAEPPS
jgi:hypothetical protein